MKAAGSSRGTAELAPDEGEMGVSWRDRLSRVFNPSLIELTRACRRGSLMLPSRSSLAGAGPLRRLVVCRRHDVDCEARLGRGRGRRESDRTAAAICFAEAGECHAVKVQSAFALVSRLCRRPLGQHPTTSIQKLMVQKKVQKRAKERR